jgi:OOP family OmpA-OmpF porin
MMINKFKTVLLAITLLLSSLANAQQDQAGSKDHPLLSRYEGSWINRYSLKQFETFTYPLSPELIDYNKLKNSKTVEGELTFIEYASPDGVTATQVFRSYQAQLTKAGFKILFSCRTGECGDLPMHFVREYVQGSSSQIGNSMVGAKGSYLVATGTYLNKPYLVSLVVGEESRTNSARYAINIVQIEELDTDKIDVATVTSQLQNEGRFAFYGIHFDTNSATIKEGSEEALEMIANYLKDHPNQQVLLVGHTDNTGDFQHNVQLSQKRAEAVVDLLTKNHSIKATQITPIGVGMSAPVASNKDEAGRALNRRVEIVLR